MTDAVIFRYSNDGTPKGALEYVDGTHEEGLDGTDVLKVTTYVRPWKRARLVWRDQNGTWREHMVDSQERTHAGGRPVVESTCINSINELYGIRAAGTVLKGTVQSILKSLVKGSRWAAGSCGAFDGARFELEVWHKNVRECIAELVDLCGGEMVTSVEVGTHGVVRREVRIVEERGSSTVRRQFRWGRNMANVKRTVGSDEVCTAIVGYGKKLLEIELEAELDGLDAEDEAIDAEQDSIDKAAASDPDDAEKEEIRLRREALSKRREALADRKKALNAKLRKARENDYLERLTVTVESGLDLARWGTPTGAGMGHTWAVYTDDECTDKAFLKLQCRKLLAAMSKVPVCYEFDAHQIDSDSWSDVRLGNSVHIVDDDLELSQVERVSGIKRRLKGKNSCTVTVGKRPANPIIEKFKAIEKSAKKSTGNSARVQSIAPVTTRGTYSNSDRYATSAPASTGGSYYSGSSTGSGGDGWTHQVNGVTQEFGTINFVTGY